MIVINLFGGPGVGKSTIASGLFSLMKKQRLNVELVTEYAKDMTWERRLNVLQDQLYVTAKQNRRLARLIDHKVDWVITDSPLPIGLLYTPEDYYSNYKPFLLEVFNSYNNVNFLIERRVKYDTTGRNQNEYEAKLIDEKLRKFLVDFNISYHSAADEHEILKELLGERLI